MSDLELMPNVSVLKFDSICRICFSQNDLKSFEQEGDLLELFYRITKIDVIHQKKLPSNVCNSCINTLIDILTFIELSKYNTAVIKQASENQMMESTETVSEKSNVQMSANLVSEIVPLYSSKICRICASLKNLVPFEDGSYFSVFQTITDIEIPSKNSHLICKKCIQKLDQISEFISSSKLNDASLHQALINEEAPEDIPEDEKISIIVEKSDSESKPSIEIKSENNEHLDIVMNSFESNSPIEYIELKPNVKEERIDIFHNEVNIGETNSKIEDAVFSKCFKSELNTNRKGTRSAPAFNFHQGRFEDKVSVTYKRQNEFKCEVCRKNFRTLHSKNTHIKSHFGKSPVLCAACGQFFVGKTEYLIHYRAHRLKEPRVKCKACSQLILKRQLREHLELHSYNHKSIGFERPFQCETCGSTFTQKHHLNKHNRLHYEEKPFACDTCPRKFSQLSHLSSHKSLHTGKNRVECEICHKIFSHASGLMRHMKRHTRKRPTCEVCGKSFSHHFNLTWHMKSHTTEKKRCEICSLVFGSNYSLERHIRTHTGEKPFKCELCPKAFSQRSNLSVHLNTHNLEKVCHICSETFTSEERLRIHLREHSGQESLTCNVCLRVFSRKRHLLDHERIHTGEKPYKCDICPKSFSQQRYLVGHISKHDNNQPQCEVCFKSFTQEDRLTVHMRMHTGEKPQCEICAKTFVRQGELNVHMKKHNQEKSFRCEICEKAFVRKCDLVRHSKIHTGDKPFECVICSKAFASKYNLTKHGEVHKKALK